MNIIKAFFPKLAEQIKGQSEEKAEKEEESQMAYQYFAQFARQTDFQAIKPIESKTDEQELLLKPLFATNVLRFPALKHFGIWTESTKRKFFYLG